ncbi:MAG TPA: UvrD-helicase domain-containing protein, partial [Blastocatellia bacterium]|nr:UvrD-helicase domain-containing protein [Blastocatellia bacterium]
MGWTDSQREAIETRGRRVLVSAGAGSGKTRVLVERFLRLLEENPAWRVSDIVAVTFTEKAAREMVSRIRKEIRSRIEKTVSVEERRLWRARRNELDSARVGTVHSLCASILRAHPSEAGLDPAFEVIEETEASALLDQAIEEALDQAVRDSKHSKEIYPSSFPSPDSGDPALIEIFGYLSLHEVRVALRSLINQGDRASAAVAKIRGLDARAIRAFWGEALARAKAE